jgi:hypothetical protein
MNETQRDHTTEGDDVTAEALRRALGSLLGSAPAPEPELNDEQFLAVIRKAADSPARTVRSSCGHGFAREAYQQRNAPSGLPTG